MPVDGDDAKVDRRIIGKDTNRQVDDLTGSG